MEVISKTARGRPSKGPRQSFTVKLDPERSTKLKEILRTLNVAGTDYLGPIIEAHVDAVDLHRLGSQQAEGAPTMAENSNTSISRTAVQRDAVRDDAKRRTQMLAWKVNLLLDTRVDASGQRYKFPTISAGADRAGYKLSRTRWSLLKEGKIQVVPDECLLAIAKVFDVDPGYLLHDNADHPAPVKEMLPKLRLKRLTEVREFALRALAPVNPEVLQALTKVLDQAIQQESVRSYGAVEGSFRWVATSRTDCRADNRRRAFTEESSR